MPRRKNSFGQFVEEGEESTKVILPHFESTVDNSLSWRIWHGTNYMLGGILFVLGSLCYYPEISKIVNGDLVGGLLFQ